MVLPFREALDALRSSAARPQDQHSGSKRHRFTLSLNDHQTLVRKILEKDQDFGLGAVR